MPTIITDRDFSAIPAYPGIAEDYAFTLRAMKNLDFDLWVASHASQFSLHEKHKPGDAYNPAAFEDKAGYEKSIEDLERQFKKKMETRADP
jgi:metallo-beta-lactamase class B